MCTMYTKAWYTFIFREEDTRHMAAILKKQGTF